MTEVFFTLLIIFAIAAVLITFYLILEGDFYFIMTGVVAGVCILAIIGMVHQDPEVALEKGKQKFVVGHLKEIDRDSIIIDDREFFFELDIAETKATEVDAHIGELVKIEYLDGDLNDYVLKVNAVNVVEKRGS